MNSFRYFCRALWVGDRPIGRSLPTQNRTSQKNADIHPCLERDRTHDPGIRAVQGHTHLTWWVHWGWHVLFRYSSINYINQKRRNSATSSEGSKSPKFLEKLPLQSSSLCSLLQPPATTSLLGPNILLSTLL